MKGDGCGVDESVVLSIGKVWGRILAHGVSLSSGDKALSPSPDQQMEWKSHLKCQVASLHWTGGKTRVIYLRVLKTGNYLPP